MVYEKCWSKGENISRDCDMGNADGTIDVGQHYQDGVVVVIDAPLI